MSDKVNNKVNEEKKTIVSEEVLKDVKDEVQEVSQENAKDEVNFAAKEKATSKNDDIFITEKDRFTIEIVYYIENKMPIIEGIDENYESDGKNICSFEMYFKYPSQRDAEYIMSTKQIKSFEDANLIDFIELENVRLVTLMRGWSISRPLEDLASIHPEIVKAIRLKVSNKIGSVGLF